MQDTSAAPRPSPAAVPAVQPQPEAALAAAGTGCFDWHLPSGELAWDDRLCRIFGLDPGTFDRRIETFLGLVLPEDVPAVQAAIARAVRRCGPYAAEYRIRRADDGQVRWIDARGRVLPGVDGRAERMLGTGVDATELHHARELVARSLEHMTDGFFALDRHWRLTYLNTRMERLLGRPREELLGERVEELFPGAPGSRYAEHFREAVATAQPVSFEHHSTDGDTWYQFRIFPRSDGVSVYVAEIPHRVSAPAGVVRDPQERARQVQAYTAAFAEAATVHEVTDVAARLVLPALGATGLLIATVDAGRMRVVGDAGYDRSLVEQLDWTPVDGRAVIAEVLRTRSPVFLTSPQSLAERHPDWEPLARNSGKAAWAFLPLIASGVGIGTLTVSFSQPREFSPEDRAVLVSLAGLMAQCIARARLHDTEHDLATALQRNLLPRRLPRTAEVCGVARYLPATQGIEVGGDWYDLISLPEGGMAAVIGDVQGHNVAAAAVMGQLRNALRAYASEGHDPVSVLTRTGRLLWQLDAGLFATCCYVCLDTGDGTLHTVRAGHPQPLVRRVDGRVEPLPGRSGLPLGVDPSAGYDVAVSRLAPGELLLLYTDGLVEDPRSPAGRQEAVRAALAAADPADLDAALAAVLRPVTRLVQRDDDVAVLLLRYDGDGPGNDREVVHLPVDRSGVHGVPALRRRLAALLRGWQTERWIAENVVLVASELVANAILHGAGEVAATVVRHRDRLRVEVSDEGTRPPRLVALDRSAMGGRGLHIVDRLSDRWGSTPRGDGKTVWFEVTLR